MAMWKVAVAPGENPEIWPICVDRDIIVIGWCQRRPEWERNPNVRGFRDGIQVGDWVVAHLPGRLAHILPCRLDHLSGVSYLGVGLGRVTGGYEERHNHGQRALRPEGVEVEFWRQRRVHWVHTEPVSLRGILAGAHLRRTVVQLTADQEQEVLHRYGLSQTG